MGTAAALEVARANPSAMLPCPGCAASVRGANLATHLEGKHPAGVPERREWSDARTLSLGSMRLDGALVVAGRFGRARRAALAAPVEVGAVKVQASTSIMSAYAADHPGTADRTTVRVGTYLRVGGLAVACPRSTEVRGHWDGWVPGEAVRRARIVVTPDGFVALQYALVATGVLRPRGG